ncbi:MAG: hypothetical protein SA339_06695 [Methanomassiliicoccus sp.]|nr:hypothetical protein [Methanomassiliicoccus sp.]
MTIRIIAPKTDPNARRLYRKFRATGRCPVAKDGVILYLINDATENDEEYILTLEMKK